MRRAQSILVIIAMLAMPLALLARSGDPGMADCNGMCCLPHGLHHSQTAIPSQQSREEGMDCHHGASQHAIECTMKSSHQGMEYGLLAPFPPTRASALKSIEALNLSRTGSFRIPAENLSSGFLTDPFQPPRR
jgi:hypothetical protein